MTRPSPHTPDQPNSLSPEQRVIQAQVLSHLDEITTQLPEHVASKLYHLCELIRSAQTSEEVTIYYQAVQHLYRSAAGQPIIARQRGQA